MGRMVLLYVTPNLFARRDPVKGETGASRSQIPNLISQIEAPGRKRRGIEKNFMIIFSKAVTPECFYRGSSPRFAWIPAKGMRE